MTRVYFNFNVLLLCRIFSFLSRPPRFIAELAHDRSSQKREKRREEGGEMGKKMGRAGIDTMGVIINSSEV
jgi:hypothetical protein